ncbi:hypothetical protein PPL_11814 [Heterostelium album PN500]|uniref:Uncharacterized protein n=1 Tax=Heterostelium pallidum (strain ATCC 26659 / Pp 5 / PN500) TaxID=670386 RepID=D3BUJ3_HETP5|nr:hypothetical protein PPL_11814 [Heterostelium album PN500]EFA74781.1 hypothetical protein PPL_11814 [Heterostelium album PN500]|eukprot:XP_020426915.1 hypothetical protein PPL_11814 [Heterostelium album PN500]
MASSPNDDVIIIEQDINEYVFIDLWESYDSSLMEKFWRELVVSTFHTSDIQPLNEWTKALSSEAHDNDDIPDLHVLLAFNAGDITSFSPKEGDQNEIPYKHSQITAAVIFEYYSNINCGLFLHMIIHKKYRNMVNEVSSLANVLRAMSPEGNDSDFLPDVHVLIAVRWPQESKTQPMHPIIDGLCVFEYHAEQNCAVLTHLILQKKNRVDGLDNLLVESTSFVELQWSNAFGSEQIKLSPNTYAEYQRMIEQIELRERIPLLDLPWDLGKPWTLVDLWEDYDRDLLERFYKEIMIPNFPNKTGNNK